MIVIIMIFIIDGEYELHRRHHSLALFLQIFIVLRVCVSDKWPSSCIFYSMIQKHFYTICFIPIIADKTTFYDVQTYKLQ